MIFNNNYLFRYGADELENVKSYNIKLTMKLFDALLYASEVWGIDCNGQLEEVPAELVQNKFLKWLLGVNKY